MKTMKKDIILKKTVDFWNVEKKEREREKERHFPTYVLT